MLIRKRREGTSEKSAKTDIALAVDQRSVAVRLLKVLDEGGLESFRTTVFKEGASVNTFRSIDQQRAKFLHTAARLVTSMGSSRRIPTTHELMQLTLQLGEIWNKAEVLRVKHTMTSNHEPGAPIDSAHIQVSWGDFLYFLIAAVKEQLYNARVSEPVSTEGGVGNLNAGAKVLRTYRLQQPATKTNFKVEKMFLLPALGKNTIVSLVERDNHKLHLYSVTYINGLDRVLALEDIYTLEGHSAHVQCMVHLPDQMLVVVATTDQNICFWDVSVLENGNEDAKRLDAIRIVTKIRFDENICCVELVGRIGPASSNMEHILLFGGNSGNIYEFNLSIMEFVGQFCDPEHENHHSRVSNEAKSCSALCSIPSLRLVVSAGEDARLLAWDLSSIEPKVIRRFKGHMKPITSICFSKKNQLLVSVGFDRDVYMWNPYVDTAVARLSGHVAPIVFAAFAQHADEILSLSNDGVLKIWDLQDLICKQTLRTVKSKDSERLAHSINGFLHVDTPNVAHMLVVTDELKTYSTIEDIDSGIASRQVTVAVLYHELEGSFITASGRLIRVWHASTGKLIDSFEIEDDTQTMQSGSLLSGKQQPLAITCMAFDRHQKELFTGDINGCITARLLSGGSPIRHLQGHEGFEVISIACIERTPGYIVSCASNGQVRIHQVHNHTIHATVLTIKHPRLRAPPMRSSDQRHNKGQSKLRKAKSPVKSSPRRKMVTFGDNEAASCDGNSTGVSDSAHIIQTAFSVPLGLLATVGADNSICVWDVKGTFESRASPLGTFYDEIDGQVVSSVTFCGSYPILVSCNMAGRVSIWTVTPAPNPYQLVDSFLNNATRSDTRSVTAPLQLAFEDESGRLLSGDVDGWISVWNLANHLDLHGIERLRPSLLYANVLNEADTSTTDTDESDEDESTDGSTKPDDDGADEKKSSELNENLAVSSGVATFLTQTRDQRLLAQQQEQPLINRVASWRAHEDALNLLKVMQTASLRVPKKFKSAVPTKSSDVTGFPIIVTASFNRCVSLWTMEGHLLGKLSEKNLSVHAALIVPQDLRVANASIEGPNDYEWKLIYNAFDAQVKADRYTEVQRVVFAIRNASLESLQPAQRDFASEKGSSILVTGTGRSVREL